MEELKEIILRTLEDIGKVSDLLYQQKSSKAYENLNNTLVKLMNLTETLFALSKEGRINLDRQRWNDNLTLAMQAMEEKDNVLLADILVFEIAGQLQEIIQ